MEVDMTKIRLILDLNMNVVPENSNKLNIDDSTMQFNASAASNNAVKNAAAKNTKTMFISSRIEKFKIKIGPKVIQSCSILRNVSTFTSDNDPIEVDMTKKQLKQFLRLHEHFAEDDPWDKEDPYWIGKFFYKMSDEEFKQLCCKADFLDSQRFLFLAANYLLIKLEAMEVEDIQKYLNIFDDYTDDERKAMGNNPLNYFINIAVGKQSYKLHMPGEDVYQINPKFNADLIPLQNVTENAAFDIHHQNFLFPQSFINFAFTALKIPEDLFFKLYCTSKYFYAKLKVIPCKMIHAGVSLTENIRILYRNEIIDLPPETVNHLNAYFCPFDQFIINEICSPENCYKLFKITIPQKIKLASIFNKNLVLTVEEFKRLFSSAIYVTLCLKIVDSNGDIVPLEDILSILPNAHNFKFRPAVSKCYTSKTTQKIAALKRNVKFKNFTLHYPPLPLFNADCFAEFIKNHAHPTYMGTIDLIFDNDVNKGIISNFYSIVIKVIDSWKYTSTKPRFAVGNFEGILFNSDPLPAPFLQS